MSLKKIIVISLSIVMILMVIGCGKSWDCSNCGKRWTGKAYRDYSATSTLCEDCAIKHWNPLPYQNYEIK